MRSATALPPKQDSDQKTEAGRPTVADWVLEPTENGSVSRWARSLPGRRATTSVRIRY